LRKKIAVDLTESIKKLNVIAKKMVTSDMIGSYRSVFRGKGLEFDSYRNYDPNEDDASRIDWKASKRANQLLVRKYVEERKIEVFFIVDVSNSMIFGSTEKLKNEYVAEFVIALTHAILTVGDKVGMALFNENIIYKIVPDTGMKQFTKIARNLVDPYNYGGGFNLSGALELPFSYLKTRGILFIVSDFMGMKNDEWQKKLKMLSARYDVICVIVRDPRDKEMPEGVGQVLVSDPCSKKEILIDSNIIKKVYEDYARKEEKKMEDMMKNSRCDFVFLNTDELFTKPIVNLFKMREKKWK